MGGQAGGGGVGLIEIGGLSGLLSSAVNTPYTPIAEPKEPASGRSKGVHAGQDKEKATPLTHYTSSQAQTSTPSFTVSNLPPSSSASQCLSVVLLAYKGGTCAIEKTVETALQASLANFQKAHALNLLG